MVRQRAWLLGVAALFLAVPAAQAQQPFPNGAKAYQLIQMQQQYLQRSAQAARPAALVATPAAAVKVQTVPQQMTVAVTAPETPQFAVDIRGPQGETRTFPVAGGPQAIQVRRYVLQPGEQMTIRLPATERR